MCWIEKESIEKMVMIKGEFLGATNQYYPPVMRGKNEYGIFNQALRRISLKYGVGIYALLYSLHPVTAGETCDRFDRNQNAINEFMDVVVRKAHRRGLITFEQGCMELTPLGGKLFNKWYNIAGIKLKGDWCSNLTKFETRKYGSAVRRINIWGRVDYVIDVSGYAFASDEMTFNKYKAIELLKKRLS